MASTSVLKSQLDPKRREIRLLALHAGDVGSAVECSVSKVSLDVPHFAVLSYMALSYVWGAENDTRPIRVDGEVVHVTANLESVLRHVRDYLAEGRPFSVWADAVCIVQVD